MSGLPTGWAHVSIGDVAFVVAGGTPNSRDSTNFAKPGEGVPWITPADLSGYRDQTISHGARDLSEKGLNSCSATLMPAGSVLFSSRAPIGYVAIASQELSTSQGFKSFVLPEGIDSRFTYYQLKHIKPEAEALATGTTFKELSGSAAATLLVKIAPTDEQRRIANKLDALFARLDACREKLDHVPTMIKGFKESVRSAALRGEITKDWRTKLQEDGVGPDLTMLLADSEVGEGDVQSWLAELPASWTVERAAKVVEPGLRLFTVSYNLVRNCLRASLT